MFQFLQNMPVKIQLLLMTSHWRLAYHMESFPVTFLKIHKVWRRLLSCKNSAKVLKALASIIIPLSNPPALDRVNIIHEDELLCEREEVNFLTFFSATCSLPPARILKPLKLLDSMAGWKSKFKILSNLLMRTPHKCTPTNRRPPTISPL